MPVNYREVAYIRIRIFTPDTERRDVLQGEKRWEYLLWGNKLWKVIVEKLVLFCIKGIQFCYGIPAVF